MFLSPVDSTDLGIEFDAQYPSFDKNFKNTLQHLHKPPTLHILHQLRTNQKL